MKNSLLKRSLALLLSIVLLLGNIPATAFATDGESAAPEVIAEETTAPTEAPAETAAPTEAATEPPAAETEAPTQPEIVPEETATPTEEPTEVPAEIPEETTVPEEDSEAGEVSDENALNVAGAIASGTCGKNLTWVLAQDGTLTISGTGVMADDYPAWDRYRNDIKAVIIEDGVTSLSGRAFNGYTNLTKVVIPASVKTFEYVDEFWNHGTMYDDIRSAFSECPGITSAGPIGSGCDLEFGWTDEIPQYAFVRLRNLKKVIMPATIKKFYNRSFYLCPGITTAGPDSSYDYEIKWTKSIPEYAFSGLSNLKEVKLPETITEIGAYAFSGCSVLEKINIPTGVTKINNGTFGACKALVGITLPQGLRSIDNSAFSGAGLQSIVLPEKLEIIGESAFGSCQFEEIVFPESLKSIGGSAFSHCDNLRTVRLPDTLTSIGSSVFYHCSGLTYAQWPASIPTISSHSFTYCENLQSIVIPKTVTIIENYAFFSCNALTEIVYLGSYAEWLRISIGKNNDPLKNAAVTDSQPISGTCGENTTWTLTRDGVLTISGQGAVTERSWTTITYQIPLKEIIVENGVTQLPAYVFDGASKVTVAASVTTIGDISNGPFSGNTSITSAGPIGSGCDYEYGWTEVIPENAFRNANNLTSIQWPEATENGGIKEIGKFAFFNCEALTEITIPDTVETIGQQAFSYCDSLEEVILPESVTTMG